MAMANGGWLVESPRALKLNGFNERIEYNKGVANLLMDFLVSSFNSDRDSEQQMTFAPYFAPGEGNASVRYFANAWAMGSAV